MITFAKLNSGAWGIRSTEALTLEATVKVAKKDGTTTSATPVKLVWSGNGIWLYALSSANPTARKPERNHHVRYECEECGDYVYPGSQCWETGMTH